MTRLVALIFGLLATVSAALAQSSSGVPYFPQTLPASTVVGRLSSGAGPTEAIPFTTLYAALAASSSTPVIVGGTGASSTLTLKSTSGVGTTDFITFRVGNNGATEALKLTTSGAAFFANSVSVGAGLVVGGNILPSTPATIGSTGTPWSHLYMGSGSTINFANGDVVITGGGNLLTFTGAASGYSFDNPIYIGGGTSALATLTLGPGTLMTTPSAGSIEYDGNAFYATPASGARGSIQSVQSCILSANFTLSNVNTAQRALNCSATGAVTLASSTAYNFEAVYYLTNTGAGSHSWGTLFGGTATFTSAAYHAQSTFNSSNALTAVNAIFSTTPASVLVVTSATASVDTTTIVLRGVLRINAGGTLIPQLQLSAAPGGTQTILANSYFRIWAIGAGSVQTVGNWN